ncbi:amidohydrolase [Alienimonas sp. DA493]|uniref:amidohydrolase n=1 Tax=Alienimonas sp. DA493 TaxID=3373605 RepID=UPI003754C604
MSEERTEELTDEQIVARVTDLLAHLWMVRTFVKHSEEAEEYEDLLELPRAAFDVARAVETRLDDVPALRRMLAKKVPKLRRAADEFRVNAAAASTHTNWQQAVISLDAVVAGLAALRPPQVAPPASPRLPTAQPPASPLPASPRPSSPRPAS